MFLPDNKLKRNFDLLVKELTEEEKNAFLAAALNSGEHDFTHYPSLLREILSSESVEDIHFGNFFLDVAQVHLKRLTAEGISKYFDSFEEITLSPNTTIAVICVIGQCLKKKMLEEKQEESAVAEPQAEPQGDSNISNKNQTSTKCKDICSSVMVRADTLAFALLRKSKLDPAFPHLMPNNVRVFAHDFDAITWRGLCGVKLRAAAKAKQMFEEYEKEHDKENKVEEHDENDPSAKRQKIN